MEPKSCTKFLPLKDINLFPLDGSKCEETGNENASQGPMPSHKFRAVTTRQTGHI